MKKSLIWLLTAVMAITFVALLYFQIMYLENMVKMRDAQFSENVMRSMHATTGYLERQETLHFLEQDINIIESSFYDDEEGVTSGNLEYSVTGPDGSVTDYTLEAKTINGGDNAKIKLPSPTQNLQDRYRLMQETIRSQYLYQKGLLNEVILTILREAGNRPVTERADSASIRKYLSRELASTGLNVPFEFAVLDSKNKVVYQTSLYDSSLKKGVYTEPLFTNSAQQYNLSVEFPTKESYVFSSVRFIIPTLALTVILLVIFLFTIILIFRQKKLSEIKTDFINNMTHELKTPISTISLAGQMLSDDSVTKSPATLKHLANVITDESKRLRFQVDKVLQLSVFDNAGGALKFSTFSANEIISNVINTFRIKVEKFGGNIVSNLSAKDSEIYADEMQFTNVISNLLDNAVKYKRENNIPILEISTRDISKSEMEITIKDNGIGIKKDNLKRIFEKFYRVPTGNIHDVKGFGLGLAYVKKMVGLFDGTITVESEYGEWTQFIIRLPLANAESKNNFNK